ncbi:MAG: reverse rubrerythrin [Bacillota bacterium]|nr:MAG: reverse rubrerythrin [Bacillota bacterium]
MTAFVCPECGYTALEYRPPECPVCRTPMDRFLSVEEGDPAWPHGHMVGMAEDCDAGVHQELVASLEAVQAGVSVCLAMARQADREGYPEIAQAYGRIAREKAAHAARLRELLGHGLTFRTGENLRTQVEAEAKASSHNQELAARAKKMGYDTIHDVVHEMAKDQARHGCMLQGLRKRFFS